MTTRQTIARGLLVLAPLLVAACPRREPAPPAAGDAGRSTVVDARRELMGTEFQVSVADVPEDRARPAIEAALAEVARVERLLSPHLEGSDVARINAAAGGEPVTVSSETLALIQQSREVSELSGGAFDITFAGLSPVWRSIRESPPRLPNDEAIRVALGLVGYRRIEVDAARRTVRLPTAGMAIGLGGIGKGYGVDRAAAALDERGIENYIVGGGGDLLVRGSKRGAHWRLGIQHPRRRGELIGEVVLDRPGALVTSGDYERFVEVDGVRYCHILDPRTGRPARGTASVTLRADTGTRADALATAVFVLGPVEGMRLVEHLDGVEAVIIDDQMRITVSSGFGDQVRLRPSR